MTTHNSSKLKILFSVLEPGRLFTVDYLESYGISHNLQKYYLKSKWLEAVGRGVYRKPNDKVGWEGALNAIQNQMKIDVHVGGLSALAMQGLIHYFRLGDDSLHLFSPQKTRLPRWFVENGWGVDLVHMQTSFLPSSLGVDEITIGQIPLRISTPERAIFECLYLSPSRIDLVECFHLLEGLINLKPKLLNPLLTDCRSVKIKRLFLYMAEKINHAWFNFIQPENVDMGNGNRMISERGIYISKYSISIPKELADL